MYIYCRSLFFSALLTLVVFKSFGIKSLKSKYQNWNETDERITVESLYFSAGLKFLLLGLLISLGFTIRYQEQLRQANLQRQVRMIGLLTLRRSELRVF